MKKDLLASALVLGAVTSAQLLASDSKPLSVDVGDIEHWQGCNATPSSSRVLSSKERCEIEALMARCTAADDCLVTCISSPDGKAVGGGCAHVCFNSLHRLSEWTPPNGWSRCAVLEQDKTTMKSNSAKRP